MIQFEWDEAKARANEKKHGVSFDDAVQIFEDPHVISEQDRIEDGELRWQSVGMIERMLVVLVAHTSKLLEASDIEVVRVISARRATRQERRRYDENRAKVSGGH